MSFNSRPRESDRPDHLEDEINDQDLMVDEEWESDEDDELFEQAVANLDALMEDEAQPLPV